MAISKLSEFYQFLPLQQYLDRAKKDQWKNTSNSSRKTLLLSQVNNLDRDLVQRLEMVGVYDTEEFFSVQNEIQEYLGNGSNTLQSMVDIINTELIRDDFRPVLDLTLPDNFAFIATSSYNNSNSLAIISDNILFAWSNLIQEGWSLVKYAFDKTFLLLDKPEMLACKFQDHPSWLNIEDITLYIGGTCPLTSVYDQVESIGFPSNPNINSSLEMAQDRVLRLKYLYEKSRENSFK